MIHTAHPGGAASRSAGGGGDAERIVLLDRSGAAIGTAPKLASHHSETPLHLAFSSYLVDGSGRVLMTERARHKRTWPGVWTNSCCGHPAPGEGLRAAVRRRLHDELGVAVERITLVLPEFAYRATMPNGVVEHEICPVVRAEPVGPVTPNPDEVARVEWLDWAECLRWAERPDASPWFREQVAALRPLGEPADWPDADRGLLPPAVTW